MSERQQLPIRAVFLGAPGAGKGRQAKDLVAAYRTLHISSGDMLREHRQKGTELGIEAEKFMNDGKLVPDDLIIKMVIDRIQQPDATESWILDGFPRTVQQAQSLDQNLEQNSGPDGGLSHVVYFEVPHEILVRRLTGRRTCSGCGAIWHTEFKPTAKEGVCDACGGELTQRADDTAEVAERRLQEYRSLTEPLLDYYRSASVLVTVSADQEPAAVFEQLVSKLKSREPA